MARYSFREPRDSTVKVRIDSEDLDRWRKLATAAGFKSVSDMLRAGVAELERQHRSWSQRLDHRKATS